MTTELKLSYTQQWATIYIMVAGTRPLSSQEVLGLLTPWLTGKLKTSQMPEVQSVKVAVVDDPDVGPVISSLPFSAGGKLYQVGSTANNIVTGIKWNLQHPTNAAISDELAGDLRAGFRSSGKQALELLGFKVFLFSIYPYNQGPGGGIVDYAIPSTPELPAPSKEPAVVISKKPVAEQKIVIQTTTPKSSIIHWLIGAAALIGVAIATRKINGKEITKEAEAIEEYMKYRKRRKR
jgi:hypothetical protein